MSMNVNSDPTSALSLLTVLISTVITIVSAGLDGLVMESYVKMLMSVTALEKLPTIAITMPIVPILTEVSSANASMDFTAVVSNALISTNAKNLCTIVN